MMSLRKEKERGDSRDPSPSVRLSFVSVTLCSILSNFRIYGIRIEDPPAVLDCIVREGSGSEQAAMLISKIFTP
jgi:hypothetical protein